MPGQPVGQIFPATRLLPLQNVLQSVFLRGDNSLENSHYFLLVVWKANTIDSLHPQEFS